MTYLILIVIAVAVALLDDRVRGKKKVPPPTVPQERKMYCMPRSFVQSGKMHARRHSAQNARVSVKSVPPALLQRRWRRRFQLLRERLGEERLPCFRSSRQMR